MKVIQVVPKTDSEVRLKALLKAKERELRSGPTAFRRQREGKWVHVKYPGWITWDEAPGGLLIAEVHPGRDGSDWQLLRAFIGYLDRHFGDQIESISILYR
jgi:hypothetical protein